MFFYVVYSGPVIVIFLITSLIFAFYDFMVRRRQVKVMKRLVREDKIVADLFPAQIRARMYEDTSGSGEFDERSLVSKRHSELFSSDLENPQNFTSPPLADLYLNTTVMFGDIAGAFHRCSVCAMDGLCRSTLIHSSLVATS